MAYTDAIEPVTVLKSKSAEIIRRARRTRRPIVITQNGRPTAVLQDVESFDRQRTALLLLLALASGERDYQAGRTVSDRTADRRFRRRLARLGRG
jgi:prevent-host-death family protein